uniref:Caspase n=1 Tax=Anopheles culicifacies TaxID=139723 RepID=A0A182MPL9_9DIPT
MSSLPAEHTTDHSADGNRVPNVIAQREQAQSTPSPQNVAFEEVYDTSNPRRGTAIILHHENFKEMQSREGSRRDRQTAITLLTNMQFDVHVYDDLHYEQLQQVLEQHATEDHSSSDCLLVMIMTHGDDGVLYAYDRMYKVDTLLEHFMGDSCPSLLGKPKLFFVQACRGVKYDVGVQLRSIAQDSENIESPKYVIPRTADILVMYSSYDGHLSWRSINDGSWFIQALCAELEANWQRMELLQLLTAVSHRVAYDYHSKVTQDGKMNVMKQMPTIVSMLTKLVYFPVKSELQ